MRTTPPMKAESMGEFYCFIDQYCFHTGIELSDVNVMVGTLAAFINQAEP